MCLPSPSDQLKFKFKPLSTTVPILLPEAKGFEASAAPTQDDADAPRLRSEALRRAPGRGSKQSSRSSCCRPLARLSVAVSPLVLNGVGQLAAMSRRR